MGNAGFCPSAEVEWMDPLAPNGFQWVQVYLDLPNPTFFVGSCYKP